MPSLSFADVDEPANGLVVMVRSSLRLGFGARAAEAVPAVRRPTQSAVTRVVAIAVAVLREDRRLGVSICDLRVAGSPCRQIRPSGCFMVRPATPPAGTSFGTQM